MRLSCAFLIKSIQPAHAEVAPMKQLTIMKLKITSLKALMLIAVCFFSIQAKAIYIWQVNGITSLTGGNTYALNATASPLTLALTQCSGGGSQPDTYTTYNMSVYSNTVNSTVGGTLVFSTVKTTIRAFSPSYTVYTPPTTSPGTLYYYVVLTNPSSTTCGFTGSLTSGTTAVTVTCQSLSVNSTKQDVSCFGLTNGSINLSATGGSGFTYAWSNGATTAAINNIAAGVYSYTVSNSCGSTVTNSVTVTEPAAGEVSVTGNTSIVVGSSTTLTASGADTYQWNPGATTADITVSPTTTTNYTVIGTVNGCSTEQVVTVVVSPPASPNGTGSSTVDSTELRTISCGAVINTMGTQIYCNPISNATNYEWKFSVAGTLNSIYWTRGTNNTNCYLNNVPGLQYGVDYDVYVRAQVGGVWGNWGTSCVIAVTNQPGTKLRDQYCGIALASTNTPIYCDAFVNATRYRFHILDNTLFADYFYTTTNADTKFLPTWIPQMQAGGDYSIEVAVELNGSFTGYGTPCPLTIAAIPAPKLRNAYCGATFPTFYNKILCDYVAGATAYEYEITNLTTGAPAFTFTQNGGATHFYTHLVPGMVHNKMYSIRVRAIIGASTGSYGTPCTITLGVPALRLANLSDNEEPSLEEALSINLFPNPATDVLNIELSKATTATAVITDITGRVLMTVEINDLTAQIKTSDLAEGSYWVTLKSDEGYSVQKFMVIK